MSRIFWGLSLFSSLLWANPVTIYRDYPSAYQASVDTKKSFLIFAQEAGKPEVPTGGIFPSELDKFVVLAAPLDHEVNQAAIFKTDPAFASLNGQPGIIRFDWQENQLGEVAVLNGAEVSVETILLKVLGISKPRLLAFKMPRFADQRVNQLISDPNTYWYDKTTMKPVYQDGHGQYQGVLTLSRPYGDGAIFDKVRGGFASPFRVTAGTDHSPNAKIGNFMRLPRKEGSNEAWPAVIIRKHANYRDLVYPKGTVFGEVIYLRNDAGVDHVVELRTRTRELDSWTTAVYRPFPEAADLLRAIEKHYPTWAEYPELVALVNHLKNPETVTPLTIGAFNVRLTGGNDVLPPLHDEIVSHLLRNTEFKACEGRAWKQNSAQVAAYAPSAGQDNFHIVPAGYQAGALNVDSQTCAQCHDQTGRNIGHFGANSLQGEIWGMDQIFSFHPFDERVVAQFPLNYPTNPIRADFLAEGMVAHYDSAKHPAEIYQRILRSWEQGR